MRAELARLKRLQRLEKVRAIALQAVTLEAAQAESTLAQLEALVARTRRMSADYGAFDSAQTGQDLHQRGQFVAGLHGISAATQGDAARARLHADRKQLELALAERRRAAVEDRAGRAKLALAALRVVPVLGARRAVGTGLE